MKGYWVAHVTVTDADQYQKYIEGSGVAFKKYGAGILARGGQHTILEGNGHARNVIIEFPSYQDALDCYNSPEYQMAKEKRRDAGIADILIVEGA
ncbi:FIG01306808: hypothetical protein [hydrothermal vent metagenome]|uniref:DUF1330 domain-containing protein n=1 Tax=hydrothermal vent metagenome TaxID=652676 RepID=A0A3B0S5X3_9ZZZZ